MSTPVAILTERVESLRQIVRRLKAKGKPCRTSKAQLKAAKRTLRAAKAAARLHVLQAERWWKAGPVERIVITAEVVGDWGNDDTNAEFMEP